MNLNSRDKSGIEICLNVCAPVRMLGHGFDFDEISRRISSGAIQVDELSLPYMIKCLI